MWTCFDVRIAADEERKFFRGNLILSSTSILILNIASADIGDKIKALINSI